LPDLIAGGLRIHYAAAPVSPRRPAIVFLHGAAANHTIWLGQMKALRGRAWVVLPDLPGHGRSQEIPGVTVDEYADVMIPFLEALIADLPAAAAASARGSRNVIVLAGHSMGGGIALLIADRRPDLLSGLVLVGTGAKLGVSAEILQGLETAPNETQALIARSQFTPGADPSLILRTIRDLAGTPARRTLADFRACNTFDVRDRIAQIAVPALVLCGSEDRMTPPRYSAYLAERMPHATLRIVDGVGHAIMIEAAETVSGVIAEFVASFR